MQAPACFTGRLDLAPHHLYTRAALFVRRRKNKFYTAPCRQRRNRQNPLAVQAFAVQTSGSARAAFRFT
jgi:hypothetical protein